MTRPQNLIHFDVPLRDFTGRPIRSDWPHTAREGSMSMDGRGRMAKSWERAVWRDTHEIDDANLRLRVPIDRTIGRACAVSPPGAPCSVISR